jgi:hypothetical protein
VLLHYWDELDALSAWPLIALHELETDSMTLEEETRSSEAPAARHEDSPKAAGSAADRNGEESCVNPAMVVAAKITRLDRLRAGILNHHHNIVEAL